MNKKWKTEEINFIKDNAHIYNDEKMTEELSKNFNREFTKDSVRKKRQRMKILKEAYRGFFKLKSKENE